MDRSGRSGTKLVAQLVRKGATLLAEPCPQCGGVQIRYLGKVYCSSHQDLSPLLVAEGLSFDNVAAEVRRALLLKLNQDARLLEGEDDLSKQEQLVSLMAECFDLLQKLPGGRQRP